MLRHLILFAVLLGFWAVLSGQLDWTDSHQRYLMICGVVSCALATLLSWRVGFLEKEGNFIRIAVRQVPYLFWLLWQIVVSNWDVARRVWSPRLDVNPSMVRTPYNLKSELAVAIYANSITLTPGTVTVLIDPEKREFLVHQLSAGGEAGLKPMHNKVAHVEGEGGEL
ncbi:MAG: Na+/H+ antiporter subunit E [Planctomycetes bacterium]|nr:Na+/H+ antiporter subunit E [Planctomycetota bacterium]